METTEATKVRIRLTRAQRVYVVRANGREIQLSGLDEAFKVIDKIRNGG